MVGIFSRFGGGRGHGKLLGGRQQEHSPLGKDNAEATKEAAPILVVVNGLVDPSELFMPIEPPMEPPDDDKPLRCPVPEPCIVHDGRMWKQRIAARRSVHHTRGGIVHHYRGVSVPPELQARHHVPVRDTSMITSFSAPENSILTLLD